VGGVRPVTFSVLQKGMSRGGAVDVLLPRVCGWAIEWLTGSVHIQWEWKLESLVGYSSRVVLERELRDVGSGLVLCEHDDVWCRGSKAAQLDRLEGVQWATLVGGALSDAVWSGGEGEWVPENAAPLRWIEKLGEGAWERFLCGYLDMAAAIDRGLGW